jgi:hopanoid C-3 methylase
LTARYRKRYFSEWFKPLASVRTSLGCTARCNFCALWSITGGKYLRRDLAAVVEMLKTIAEPNVFFCDDESMCDARRMDRLADLIREAGIRKNYFLYGRADTIVRHPELFAKWAGIGLAQVFVGMEDYSDQRLAAMNKGITSDQQAWAAKILDELGIMVYASYMVDPAYTREDFRGLPAYVRKMKHQ